VLHSPQLADRTMVGPERLIERAAAFGMRTAIFTDACDPIAVCDTIQAAVDQARADDGPIFSEAMTRSAEQSL
jgi:TPP-dependent pyruvate/acetoin dehydrogenase alpha subunit